MKTAAVPANFLELIALEQVAEDFYLGHTPSYPWGRVFGGQVVAQALYAAAATVANDHRVHSLHAYFVLGGTPRESILFEVDRLREGRSFTTRRVVARQSSGAILNLDASFQRAEPDVDVQESVLPVGLPAPETLPISEWGAFGDVREIPPEPGSSAARAWMRIAQKLPDDPVLHACGLAYLSDHNPMDAIVRSHPHPKFDDLMCASLDHALWFHRFARADEWMLFDMRGHGLVNARGMATGSVFSQPGVHLASVAQEGLVRRIRETHQPSAPA